MLVVLLGYMGSGKSTVGKLLGERLNLPFTDLDEYIESEVGTAIPEIFREKGELFFSKKGTRTAGRSFSLRTAPGAFPRWGNPRLCRKYGSRLKGNPE